MDRKTARGKMLVLARAYHLMFSDFAIKGHNLSVYLYIKCMCGEVSSREVADHFDMRIEIASTVTKDLFHLGYDKG